MELNIPLEDLRSTRLCVATPQYGGQNHGAYMKSCLALQALMTRLQVEMRFSFIFNESLITRARNLLVDKFLQSNYTHLLFVDSDLEFDPNDVLTLLALDRDVIGAPYVKKTINWESVKRAVLKNPEITGEELERVAGNFVFHTSPDTQQIKLDEPLEVLALGTGFILIKREVFATFARAYPDQQFQADEDGHAVHAFFDTAIDPETQRYLSEDYVFCQNWRKIGGKLWLCPWMNTRHWGSYGFHGNLVELSRHQ